MTSRQLSRPHQMVRICIFSFLLQFSAQNDFPAPQHQGKTFCHDSPFGEKRCSFQAACEIHRIQFQNKGDGGWKWPNTRTKRLMLTTLPLCCREAQQVQTWPDHSARRAGTEAWNGADVKTVHALQQAKPNRKTARFRQVGSYLSPAVSTVFH